MATSFIDFNFLVSRNIEYAFQNFIMNKINDDIGSFVNDEKLMEFSLIYGDILPYHGMFPPNINSVIPTYRERVAELKEKIRRAHPIKKDKRNHPVFINKNYRIKIKLKYYGNNNLKRNKVLSSSFLEVKVTMIFI